MDIVTKILGSLLALFSISMWYGHKQYVKRKIPFQIATAYQTILVTFTSIGLLVGCHLWIVVIAIPLWWPILTILVTKERMYEAYKSKQQMKKYGRVPVPSDLASQFKIPKLFKADYVLFYAILIFTADFCLARGLSLLGWIASFIVAAILYFISLNLAFPELERREWK
ncbi:hypothetical protein KJ830_05885 [bacterium]|nr:hypothetical protein [bacterium]MBU4510561.1 hypothetical protein [bacterium]